MAANKNYTVKFNRRNQNKTNYNRRLKLVKSHEIRLVIRTHLNNIIAQFVQYDDKGDKVLINVNSKNLVAFGWKGHRGNLPSAYLTGLYAGLLAKKKNIKKAILDSGSYTSIKGSRIYAALKGVVDSGMDIPHSKTILPSEDTISGEIISNYATMLSKDPEAYKKQFGSYIKRNMKPEQLPLHFKETKEKIMHGVN